MTATVYTLTRNGTPFYVGCTVDTVHRLRDHRKSRADDTIQLHGLATYSTAEAAFRAERIAWESLRALGHPIENARPTGKPPSADWSTYNASMTPEQRSARMHEVHAALTPEQRASRTAQLTPEARARGGRTQRAKINADPRHSEWSRNGAARVNAMRVTCPDCGFVSNPSGTATHRKFKHRAVA